MANRLYVGNLPFSFTQQDLEQLFSSFGAIRYVEIISDRMTGQSRGFGFVELETPEQAQAAIQSMHGRDIQGRGLTVNEARERTARDSRIRRGDTTRGTRQARWCAERSRPEVRP